LYSSIQTLFKKKLFYEAKLRKHIFSKGFCLQKSSASIFLVKVFAKQKSLL